MLARISPEAALRLEEGLRAMAQSSGGGLDPAAGAGDRLGPMERLGQRQGYALDYMRLEFSYTQTSERTVQDADGTSRREVSSTQIDLSLQRLEVAFRGKADGAPAFLGIDAGDLAFGRSAVRPMEALPEADIHDAGLKSLLQALELFRTSSHAWQGGLLAAKSDGQPNDQRDGQPNDQRDPQPTDKFGLKRLGEGRREPTGAPDSAQAAPGRNPRRVELLFA